MAVFVLNLKPRVLSTIKLRKSWFIAFDCTPFEDLSVVAVVNAAIEAEQLPAIQAWSVDAQKGEIRSFHQKYHLSK